MRILLAIALVALVGCDYQEWSAERERKAEEQRVELEREAEEQRIERERNANLSYGPGGWLNWQYVNDGDVQYAPYEGSMRLRRVKSEDHVVNANLDDEGFRASAYWKTDCEEGTEIETSETFADGSPMMLECQRHGDNTWLRAGTLWETLDEPLKWIQDYDGFEVSEDFTLWDWTKAKQYATLQKAKPADSQEDE